MFATTFLPNPLFELRRADPQKKFVKEWVVLAFGARAVFIERETTRAEAETFWRALRALAAGEHPAALLDELSAPGRQPRSISEPEIKPALLPHEHDPAMKPEFEDGEEAPPSRKRSPEPEEDGEHKRPRMDLEPDEYDPAHAHPHVAPSQSIQPGSAGNAYPERARARPRAPAPKKRSESPELDIFVKPEPKEPVLPHTRRRRAPPPEPEPERALVPRSPDIADEDPIPGELVVPDVPQDELMRDVPLGELAAQDVNRPRRPLVWKDFPAPKYVNNPKPMPANMRPRVWASARTDFCETIPWFHSYQSGVYSRNNVTYGYMVGATPAPRDLWMHDGKLIISHGGGSSRASKEPGEGDDGSQGADDTPQLNDDDDDEQLADDSASVAMSPIVRIKPELEPETDLAAMDMDNEQALDTSPGKKRKGKRSKVELTGDQAAHGVQVDPLVHSAENGHPILLLVDRDYERFPWDLSDEHKVAVLGWYWIKAHWEEAEPSTKAPLGYWKRVKLAFQWVEGQGDPWWIPQPASSSQTHNPRLITAAAGEPSRRRKLFSVEIKKPAAPSPKLQRCSTCGSISPLVYRQGWMCLASICRAFWRLADGSSPCGEGLTYDAQFLALAPTPPHLRAALPSYEPDAPPKDPMHGLWCKKCGLATCRSRWEGWECDMCKTQIRAPYPVHSAKALAPVKGDPPCGIWTINAASGITAAQFTRPIEEGGTLLWINRFTFPAGRGVVYHIRGNDAVNHLADDILPRYQRHFADSHLMRRHELVQTKLKGTRTKYFAQNFGVPYKYVATTGTTISFDQAPSCVTDSRALIHDRMRLVGQETEFNELLVAGYLPGQQMGYHSDAEPGLGETIASLSLGAPAEMKFQSRRPARKRGSERVSGKKEKALLTMQLYHVRVPQLQDRPSHGDLTPFLLRATSLSCMGQASRKTTSTRSLPRA